MAAHSECLRSWPRLVPETLAEATSRLPPTQAKFMVKPMKATTTIVVPDAADPNSALTFSCPLTARRWRRQMHQAIPRMYASCNSTQKMMCQVSALTPMIHSRSLSAFPSMGDGSGALHAGYKPNDGI